MAMNARKKPGNRVGSLLNSRLGRAAVIGGAAWATTRYFQNRAKNRGATEPTMLENQAGALDNNQAVMEDSPSQTGQWSAKPAESERHAKLPEAEPDNMPGPTETLSHTIWHRY